MSNNAIDEKWSGDLQAALESARLERLHQYVKWGVRTYSFSQWIAVLIEEVGELSKEIIREEMAGRPRTRNLRKEACDVAAVALAIIQQIDTGKA